MKINLQDIRSGPASLEQALKEQFPQSAQTSDPWNRYKGSIKELEEQAVGEYIIGTFCLAHCSEQAARIAPNRAECVLLLEKAFENLQLIIQDKESQGEEYFYYSYLLMGDILQGLNQPWAYAEEAYLSAYEIAPTRGEGVQYVIEYYLSQKEWAKAYKYSSFSVTHFYDHLPASAHWALNPLFYQWKVLNMHVAASFSLGKMQEALWYYSVLLERTKEKPQLFTPEEIRKIESKKSLFQKEASS